MKLTYKPFSVEGVRQGDLLNIGNGNTPYYYVGMSKYGSVVAENSGVLTYAAQHNVYLVIETVPECKPYTIKTFPRDSWFRDKNEFNSGEFKILKLDDYGVITLNSSSGIGRMFHFSYKAVASQWVQILPEGTTIPAYQIID